MAVAVEMHNTGDPELQRDVVVIVEHVLSDRPVGVAGLNCRLAGKRQVGDEDYGA